MNTDDEIMKRLSADAMPKAQKVDPSVKLGKLEGEPFGCVDMAVTIGKPQAYKSNRYSKGMGNE